YTALVQRRPIHLADTAGGTRRRDHNIIREHFGGSGLRLLAFNYEDGIVRPTDEPTQIVKREWAQRRASADLALNVTELKKRLRLGIVGIEGRIARDNQIGGAVASWVMVDCTQAIAGWRCRSDGISYKCLLDISLSR